MKKIFTLIAAIAMSTVLMASGGSATANVAPDIDTIVPAGSEMKAGKLYFVNLKKDEQPIMPKIRIAGNRAGNQEEEIGINYKPYASEGIRCIFELNEWVEFYPQSNAKSGIAVWVFEHKDNVNFYETASLSDETPGYVEYRELNEDPEKAAEGVLWDWGSLYVHPEEHKPGFYDFVFTYGGKIFAVMLTKFYKEEELYDKSDSELNKMMEGLSKK
jgi:hypothetical protein